jgi:hypothetical protein
MGFAPKRFVSWTWRAPVLQKDVGEWCKSLALLDSQRTRCSFAERSGSALLQGRGIIFQE